MLAEAITVLFLWTNPDLNQDGTPCTDLAEIKIRGVEESTGHQTYFSHPLCSQTPDGVVCLSGPGLPDSMRVTFPVRQGDNWWHFDAWAYDSTGNESWPSNTVRLNLGSGAPITGVPVDPTVPTRDEWFDVAGRKIERPEASGVYFRRRGKIVEKVVVVK